MYFYQTTAYQQHRRDGAEYAACAGPDPQLEQIPSAPGRSGDDAALHQLWDTALFFFGFGFFFSAGKDFANVSGIFFIIIILFLIPKLGCGVFFLQDFVFILSSANSTLAVISPSKI